MIGESTVLQNINPITLHRIMMLLFSITRIAILILHFLLFSYFVNVATAQEQRVINYEDLDELNVEVIIDTKDQEGVYSVNLRNLVVTSGGTLLVSDLGKTTIEQYNYEGKFIEQIASEGQGPGELPFIFNLFITEGDTLIVWHEQTGRADYFYFDSDGIYKYVRSVMMDQFPSHRLEVIGYTDNGKFFAYTGHTDAALISSGMPEYRNTPVALLNESLKVHRDSLHMVKKPSYILADPSQFHSPVTIGGLAILGMPPYRYEDYFILLNQGRYMIARPGTSNLYFYTSNHELEKKVSIHAKDRRVERKDLQYAFRDHRLRNDLRIIRKLESYVKEKKPPFLNVWASENHILMHTDNGEKGKEMAIFTKHGKAVGKFYLSEYDEVHNFNHNRIYVLHKNPIAGHSIRIYRINF